MTTSTAPGVPSAATPLPAEPPGAGFAEQLGDPGVDARLGLDPWIVGGQRPPRRAQLRRTDGDGAALDVGVRPPWRRRHVRFGRHLLAVEEPGRRLGSLRVGGQRLVDRLGEHDIATAS